MATEFGERRPFSWPWPAVPSSMSCSGSWSRWARSATRWTTAWPPWPSTTASATCVSWIERLAGPERDELRAEVERQADGLRRRWPALDPAWLPRTQEAMRVGWPAGPSSCRPGWTWPSAARPRDEASVAIVEIKSGSRRVEHRADLHFYALLETLRSPAPPFVVATYYTRTGELDVDPVTEELLVAAARRDPGRGPAVGRPGPGRRARSQRRRPCADGARSCPSEPAGRARPAWTGGQTGSGSAVQVGP